MQELTHTRHSGQRDPLNNCASLDKAIETEDGSGDTLGDFVPDPTALDFLELLDAQSVAAMIRNEVQNLPDRECEVITGFFFDGMTLEQIANKLGVTFQRASQLKKRGLVNLSRRRVLVDLWNEMHHTAMLRKLECSTRGNEPRNYDSARIYERRAELRTKNTPLDLAFRHAEQLRKRAETAGEAWTREQQITAIVEYLHKTPVNT